MLLRTKRTRQLTSPLATESNVCTFLQIPIVSVADILSSSDGFFFAMYTALIVHVALYYHKELAEGFRSMWKSASGREGCKV
jgi:hypothetical protein